MEWFRFYVGTTTDPKFRVVAKKAGSRLGDVLSVWQMILERACASAERGRVDGFDCEGADALLDLDDGSACKIFAAMESKGLIVSGRVAAWEKRQPKREREEDSSNRVKAFRERQKLASIATCDNVTPCNAMKRQETRVTGACNEIIEKSENNPLNQGVFEDSNQEIEGELNNENQINTDVYDNVTPCNATQRQETPRGEEIREEKNKERNTPPPPSRGVTRPPAADREFDEFWQAFPKKKSKGQAKKAWDKLRKEKKLPPLPTMLQAIAAAKAGHDWQKDGGKYIPYPATWLNGERWEDEPTQVAKVSGGHPSWF